MIEEEKLNNTYYEAQINKFNFRYRGGNIIEVAYLNDKNKTPIHEIVVKPLPNEKKFHSEISFWFMEEGANF